MNFSLLFSYIRSDESSLEDEDDFIDVTDDEDTRQAIYNSYTDQKQEKQGKIWNTVLTFDFQNHKL